MIQSIRLQNYRSYIDETFELKEGVNIIVGPNAIGKTNLLESILVVARGNSFRAHDAELVAFNKQWARIDARTQTQSRTVKIMLDSQGVAKKEFIIDQSKFTRLVLRKRLPVVLFEPSILSLLHGSPEKRRDYFDDILIQTNEGYAKKLRDYKRVVAQRNALLKQGMTAASQLFAWNIRLSELAGQIIGNRLELIAEMNNKLNDMYVSLAGDKSAKVSLEYVSDCHPSDYASNLLKQLEARQKQDLERGYTTIGPHRDDIMLLLNGYPAAVSASRGETRTAILSLKIIELGIIEEAFKKKPLVLLDDVFSELDGKRRQALTEVIKGYQSFITTTDADVVVQHFMEKCHIIPL